MSADPRIDAYIAHAQPFAQPILEHLRALIHMALPEAEEAIKWGMPHFTIGGKNVAGMAAFKAHAAFMIHGEGRQGEDGMGQYGKLTALTDLPGDAQIIAKLHGARQRLGSPREAPIRAKEAPKPEIAMPDDFAKAIADRPAAQAFFEALAPSYRREYLEWIVTAKAPATRAKRIADAATWLGEGKKRNWKYEGC